MYVCNSFRGQKQAFFMSLDAHQNHLWLLTGKELKASESLFLKLIEENVMKEPFAGARSERPIGRK